MMCFRVTLVAQQAASHVKRLWGHTLPHTVQLTHKVLLELSGSESARLTNQSRWTALLQLRLLPHYCVLTLPMPAHQHVIATIQGPWDEQRLQRLRVYLVYRS